MKKPNAKELTAEYMNKTLPEGYYYFSVAGTKPFIGKYTHPTTFEISHAAANGLPEPKPQIQAYPGLLRGQLETVTVLAPVPTYDQLIAGD